jgi:hypothetical protein
MVALKTFFGYREGTEGGARGFMAEVKALSKESKDEILMLVGKELGVEIDYPSVSKAS